MVEFLSLSPSLSVLLFFFSYEQDARKLRNRSGESCLTCVVCPKWAHCIQHNIRRWFKFKSICFTQTPWVIDRRRPFTSAHSHIQYMNDPVRESKWPKLHQFHVNRKVTHSIWRLAPFGSYYFGVCLCGFLFVMLIRSSRGQLYYAIYHSWIPLV